MNSFDETRYGVNVQKAVIEPKLTGKYARLLLITIYNELTAGPYPLILIRMTYVPLYV